MLAIPCINLGAGTQVMLKFKPEDGEPKDVHTCWRERVATTVNDAIPAEFRVLPQIDPKKLAAEVWRYEQQGLYPQF